MRRGPVHNGPMGGSLRLGRIAGIPISVNLGLAVLAAVFIASLALQGLRVLDPEASLSARLIVASVTVGAFLASILAHELGHAIAARSQDVGVLGITLSLLGGYAQLDRQAPTPKAEFVIAAAGPAVNLVIGGIGAAAAFVIRRWDLLGQWPRADLATGALIWLAGVNIVLALFNLIPASPLDGGRVLTAALWRRLGDAELARIVSGRAGLIFGAVLAVVAAVQFVLGGWQGLVTLVVALFLFNGARGEIGNAAIRRRLRTTTTAELMVPDPPSLADSMTADQLANFAGGNGDGVVFPVVRWEAEPIGYVVANSASGLGPMDRASRTVGDLMRPSPEVARAWMTEPVDDVLRRLRSEDDAMVVVVHEPRAGRAVGTLGHRQVAPLFSAPSLWGNDRPSTDGSMTNDGDGKSQPHRPVLGP